MEITIHRCIKIRVARYLPDINNAIVLQIITDSNDPPDEITLFGLEEKYTKEMMARLADKNTTISRHKPDDVAA